MRQRKIKSADPSEVKLMNGHCETRENSTERHKEKVVKELKLERIKDNIKNLQVQSLQRLDKELKTLVDSVFDELERYDGAEAEDIIFSSKHKREDRPQRKDEEKRFVARASLLTELMEVKHIRSVYHMFVAALIIALISGAIGDFLRGGWQAIRVGIRHVPQAFGHFDRALLLWVLMFTCTCLVHYFLKVWNQILRKSISKKFYYVYNRLSLTLLIVYLVFMNYLVLKFMGNTAPATSVFLLLEQTRFLMKIHAYVRTNVVRSPIMPEFSNFLYFLFAPTLIYRDNYPRTSRISWRFVGGCLFEFFGAILMQSCILELHILPEFSKFGIEKQTPGSLAALISRTVLPAFMFILCGFYLFLHSWLNAWAEVLRFADRKFYDAWWNSNSYGEYYRTWNIVVHDYLHTYIYKDVKYLTNSTVGKIAVFAVSAVVHEYILALMLGFCYPVMFAQFFGLGVALGFVRNTTGKGRAANVFMWATFSYGVGIQFSLYSMEAFARINCPQIDQNFASYFIPRSWSCNGLNL